LALKFAITVEGDVLTIRLATAPDAAPMPGALRVQLEGLQKRISLSMPVPGTAVAQSFLAAPQPAPDTFTITIAYYLDEKRVGVVVDGVADGDALNIFASRLDSPMLDKVGVLYESSHARK
jgi:hypothetical protein